MFDFEFWLVICGFIIAFVLAFGIGANDVANSFGTSVGSKVLTLKQACVLATIFEILGSILIGAKVSGTIRKGIMDPNVFEDCPKELMLGYVSALIGCCVWLILATVLNYPVSGTHSIVGATVGMAIVSKGFKVIAWKAILKIVASWFISPLLSGIVSLIMFVLIRKHILRAGDPLEAGLKFLPFIYTVTICINIGGILESSPPLLGLDKLPGWSKIALTAVLCLIVYLTVWLVIVPLMKKKVQKQLSNSLIPNEDEKEQLNNCEKDTNHLCKTVSTQVDYVTLIISRNNEENRIQEDKKKEFEDENQLIKSFHNSSLTLPTDASISENKNRVRTITVPSSNVKDMFDYGDVNLTLRGYLHTIHTQKLNQKSNQTKDRLSNTNSIGAGTSHSDRGGASLSKLFTQQSVPSDVKMGNEESLIENKRGRFNLVPAQVELKPIVGESLKSSMLELDDEVKENIDELPTKKIKKMDVDEFAHVDPPEAAKLFSFLQVLTAVFGSFAHGGNDVSNAIGPLIGLYLIYQGKITQDSSTPEWILFYGGVGISAGLWILGRRVIKTIGEDLTKITASSGFVIELASAITVLGASLLNIPVSTTHCKVGSVVFTGRIRSKESVDWSLFRNIIIAWIVTVPVTGTIAGCCQFILKLIFIPQTPVLSV
ncbi:unnamed protein product [Brachionus calyciflorus]|uniref:Phosphate transporter n=1 Tax=Brachionus calyciflorus TaxID=104777 RepID=A0A814FW94_9BILA|nr:unnamed protein product [Brachionus calyciflorus]